MILAIVCLVLVVGGIAYPLIKGKMGGHMAALSIGPKRIKVNRVGVTLGNGDRHRFGRCLTLNSTSNNKLNGSLFIE